MNSLDGVFFYIKIKKLYAPVTITLFSCYQSFFLIIFNDSDLHEFTKLNFLGQAFITYKFSTLHDIFPVPTNLSIHLNNIMISYALQECYLCWHLVSCLQVVDVTLLDF